MLLKTRLSAFFTRQRLEGIGLVTAGSLGVLTVLVLIVALIIGMTVPTEHHQSVAQASAAPVLAPSPKGDLFGTIEIGSSGIKGIIWRITPGEAKTLFEQKAGIEAARYKVFAHAMVRHFDDFNTKLQDARNIGAAVDAVADFVKRMRGQHVPPENIYIVASSGVADLPQLDEIKRQVIERTGKTPDVINAERECDYTFQWVVPDAYTYDSAAVDVGSGNTKACYVEHGTYGDRVRGLELVPYGAKTYETKVNAERKGADFATVSARLVQSVIDPPIEDGVAGNPGLLTRRQVYFSGGTAWVTAMLMHPDKAKDDYIDLSLPADFTALRKKTVADQADLASLGDPFTPNQLVAGLDVATAVAQELKLAKRAVLFPAPARDAWMSNYLMEKLAQSETQAE